MFGYVIANKDKLNNADKEKYQSCYCGLCRALKKRGRLLSSLTLNYDTVFLIIVLMSVYDAETENKEVRCNLKCKKMPCMSGELIEYAADMNTILSYYKMEDNFKDDKNLFSYLASLIIKKEFKKSCIRYEKKAVNIKKYLDILKEYEDRNALEPDTEAGVFGDIMGEIFTPYNEKKEELYAFGKALGEFIFIMDAVMDLKSDIKRKRYNPLVFTDKSTHEDMLSILMADCYSKYENMNIEKNKELIENILFSGVWTHYKARGGKHK